LSGKILQKLDLVVVAPAEIPIKDVRTSKYGTEF
jgi:hypothetical protein